jgi:hypothetical protein
VDLDFPHNKLSLSPLPPFPDEPAKAPGLESSQASVPLLHNRYIPQQYATFERFYRFGHEVLLPTQVNKPPWRLFLVDTGAFDNTISPVAARATTSVYSESDIRVKGLNGEVKKVYTAGDVSLVFGHFKQERHDLVAFDMKNISDWSGIEISGTLGFAMLWMLEIKIDYRDHLIDFQYTEHDIRATRPDF